MDKGQMGGTVVFDVTGDTWKISRYTFYFATTGAGADRQVAASSVPYGTNEAYVNVDYPTASYTYLVVYTQTWLAESATPAALNLLDMFFETVSFIDLDFDKKEIGGNVTWLEPEDKSSILKYEIYFANDADGLNRTLVDTSLGIGITTLHIPADTMLFPYTYISVYSVTVLGEQTTPASVKVVDAAISVSGIVFVDRDLDATQIGGRVDWNVPHGTIPVVHPPLVILVNVAMATNRYGAGFKQIAQGLPSTQNYLDIPVDFPLGFFTHILVYTESSLAEQSTPESGEIRDVDATVQNLNFTDYDLDQTEVMGPAYCAEAQEPGAIWKWSIIFMGFASPVERYYIYFAADINGTNRTVLGEMTVGSTTFFIDQNTKLWDHEYLLVYAQSTLAEQTTPAYVPIYDNYASVSGLDYIGRDLDPNQLGGRIIWTPPKDPEFVVRYMVYLATNTIGQNRFLLGQIKWSPGINQLDIPPNFPEQAYTEILVYTMSELHEQTTPTSHNFYDTVSIPQNGSFSDLDLDSNEL
jgi:hypothetical protein